MVLNIVKNDLPASCIAEYVRCVFDNAKVNIKDENAVSVDIEVTGKNELHSLEGLKELEYYFKDYNDIYDDKHLKTHIYSEYNVFIRRKI